MRLRAQPREAAIDGVRHGGCKQLGQALGLLQAQESTQCVTGVGTL